MVIELTNSFMGRVVALTLLLVVALTIPVLGADVWEYDLDATFHPVESRIEARALVRFGATDGERESSVFYLHGELSVDSVLEGAETIPFSSQSADYSFNYTLTATQVSLSTPVRDSIEVFYSGYFHPSDARSPSDYMRIDSNGIFLRAYGYSLWFPIFLEARQEDQAVEFGRVTLRTPETFRAVFAGTQLSDVVSNDWRTSTWTASDIRLRDVQCTAQRYRVLSSGQFHIYHYPDSGSTAVAGEILKLTETLLNDYKRHYRPEASAAENYVIEMPMFGDISSENVTGMSEETWTSFTTDSYAQRTLAHELVHSFVSVPTPREDSIYALVVEGFPSYFHLPVLMGSESDSDYAAFMKRIEEGYLTKRQTGVTRRGNTLPPEIPILAIGPDDVGQYKDMFVLADRALLFLDYLYRRMGREQFFKFTSEMFSSETLTLAIFTALLESHLPGSESIVRRWLATSDFPEEFRRD